MAEMTTNKDKLDTFYLEIVDEDITFKKLVSIVPIIYYVSECEINQLNFAMNIKSIKTYLVSTREIL
jgi:hypothetical protein